MSALPDSFPGRRLPTMRMRKKPANGWTRLSAVIGEEGRDRGHFLLEQLLEARAPAQVWIMPFSATTGYVNSIEPDQDEAHCLGNVEIEERLRAYMRWNAMAMVVKANRLSPEDGGDLGGHIWLLCVGGPRCLVPASTTSGMPTRRKPRRRPACTSRATRVAGHLCPRVSGRPHQ